LLQGGFSFPWQGDLLVRRSPIFACKALPRDRALRLGAADTHAVIRAGDWTVYLEIQSGVRFPAVERAIPAPGAAATRLRLDPADAAFLLPALGRLPGAEEVNTPATLDLNGRVAVRAAEPGGSQATELVLSRSGYDGPPVRVGMNRTFLARAARLGFAEVEVIDAGSPLVCRDGRRTFAWQPLGEGSAIEPADDVTRIESNPDNPRPASRPGAITKARSVVSEPNGRAVPGGNDNTAAAEGGPGLAGLIREAEALRGALGDAKAKAARLALALRRQRKRERLVAAAMATLRELKLPGVAG
jgi:hypothetical protein